jgi:hypothetical protein
MFVHVLKIGEQTFNLNVTIFHFILIKMSSVLTFNQIKGGIKQINQIRFSKFEELHSESISKSSRVHSSSNGRRTMAPFPLSSGH